MFLKLFGNQIVSASLLAFQALMSGEQPKRDC